MIAVRGIDFEYYTGWDWSRFQQNVDYGKVCICGVQTKKIQLSISCKGQFIIVPMVYEHNHWRVEKLSKLAESKFKIAKIVTEDDLKATLANVLFAQYPDAKQSYWETLPKFDSVLFKLAERPEMATLDEMRYTYYITQRAATNVNGGKVCVMCEEGHLEIPYLETSQEKEKWTLQIAYYRKRYDSAKGYLQAAWQNIRRRLLDFVS